VEKWFEGESEDIQNDLGTYCQVFRFTVDKAILSSATTEVLLWQIDVQRGGVPASICNGEVRVLLCDESLPTLVDSSDGTRKVWTNQSVWKDLQAPQAFVYQLSKYSTKSYGLKGKARTAFQSSSAIKILWGIAKRHPHVEENEAINIFSIKPRLCLSIIEKKEIES
jgi:hypothetical protein